jgi:hypothetical protein
VVVVGALVDVVVVEAVVEDVLGFVLCAAWASCDDWSAVGVRGAVPQPARPATTTSARTQRPVRVGTREATRLDDS